MSNESVEHLNFVTSLNRTRENDLESNDAISMPFELQEVEKLVKKAKKGKAPGLDSIIYESLENTTVTMALVRLFNECLFSGFIPSVWRKAIIFPIPKAGNSDPRVPLNYRGISLLPVISKLYTAGLSNRISSYFEKTNTLANEQNGFRPNRSCLDHVFT